jgi:hypothetical protein
MQNEKEKFKKDFIKRLVKSEAQQYLKEAEEIANIIGASVLTLKDRK